MDSAVGELVGTDGRVPLAGLSMALLLALARRAGQLSDTDSLIAEVWEREEVTDATLQQRVKLLRRALNDDSDTPRYIATVRGRGYRLLLQPQLLGEPETAPPAPRMAAPPAPHIAAPSRRSAWLLLAATALILAAASWWYWGKPAPAIAHSSLNRLVVLPLSQDALIGDDGARADDMTEQLIWNLSRVPGLVVIGRSSSMSYKDERRALAALAPQLARDLDVGAVLQGRMERAGKGMQLTLTLTRMADLQVIWNRRLELSDEGLTNMHALVVQQVTHALGVQQGREAAAIVDGDALSLYLRGRQLYLRYGEKDNTAAMELFRASLAHSPAYAPALAGLSDTYAQAVYQFGAPDNQLDDALRYADAAVKLAPELAEAHKARGLALDLLGRRSEAAASYHIASALNPNYSDALINEAILYWEGGRLADAYRLTQRAIALDPLDPYAHLITSQVLTSGGFAPAAQAILAQVQQHAPDNAMAQTIRCAHWFEMGQNERAETICQALIKQHADFAAGWSLSGDLALGNGQTALAAQRYTTAAGLGVGSDAFYAKLRLAVIAQPLRSSGLTPMLKLLRGKIAQHDENPELHLQSAMLLAALGQVDEGMAALEAAVRLGHSDRHWLETDPVLAPLRKHARYAPLLATLDERLSREHNKLRLLLKAQGRQDGKPQKN